MRNKIHFYPPQRSWAKASVSVILFTGGGGICLSACWDTQEQTPPRSRHPQEQTPPQEKTPPKSRHPHPPKADTPQEQTPPQRADTPPGKQTPAYGQRAAGTHPTGMHSCGK